MKEMFTSTSCHQEEEEVKKRKKSPWGINRDPNDWNDGFCDQHGKGKEKKGLICD